jgi:hypothetical protein
MQLGVRPNPTQVVQQLLQVLFVGMTLGMMRNVVPALAESSEAGSSLEHFSSLLA